MRPLATLSVAMLLAASAAAPAAHAAAEVVSGAAAELALEVGKGRLIRLDRAAKTVFIGDPKIADVQVKSPTLVYVVGKAPGGTSLFAVDAADQMVANLGVAVGFDAPRLQDAIRQHAPDSEVRVSSVNDAVVLSGKVVSPAQGEEVLRMAARFVFVDNQADRADRGERLINRLTVETPNQVNLRVRVVEVSKSAREVLGFNWESLGGIGETVLGLATGSKVFEGAAGTSDILARQNGVNSIFAGSRDGDINVLIDALKQKGLVTVLAEPNLTAVSGEEASFLAGGEYPIPVPQGDRQITIDYKKYGVSLAFVATILDAGRISLKVRPEVSQLTQAGAITLEGVRVPALTTRRADTTVDLGSGQSFAIAGLLQRTTSEDIKKLPALGDVPVLGQLFRSKEFQKSESELVIIVTPYLVKPSSQKLATPADLFPAVEGRSIAADATTETEG
ncbi:type II and III secretion system protein family protein [Phenylobacterium sp.]|jgi:pilus assembly protein CpaC|uniref:type II and III secretion system protein family protein n=1 Tax=Phenylobacterium sp. TaxID=1871053 RepID=UPI00378303B1